MPRFCTSISTSFRTLLFTFFTVFAFAAETGTPSERSLQDFYNQNFEKFPAQSFELKTKAQLQMKGNAKARRYRTQLRQAWSEAQEPNFAGHFFIPKEIGCGVGCLVIFVIDWNTGKIYSPPEDHFFEAKKSSRLLILKPYDECTYYGPPLLLEFRNLTFKVIQHSRCKKEVAVTDPISELVKKLNDAGSGGLWTNGVFPRIDLPLSAKVEQVVERYFEQVHKQKTFQVVEIRKVEINQKGYSAALVKLSSKFSDKMGGETRILLIKKETSMWWTKEMSPPSADR